MDEHADSELALHALIRSIEAAAYDAWPAEITADLEGWRLRASQGVTGRANSVWALHEDGAIALAARVDAVEAFYAARGLAPRFQINAAVRPSGLDAELERRGYRIHSPALVQAAPLRVILERTPPLRLLPAAHIEVAESFDEVWFALYQESSGMEARTAAVRASIVQRIAGPVAFARLDWDEQPAAVGLGVVGGGWLGISCMETLQSYRRRGAATALLRALAIWASLHGAQGAYLQVMAGNADAQSVYARAGFEILYPYHYRIRE